MEGLDLPLTVPVHMIIVEALSEIAEDCGGLDRDEAYLLARLQTVPEDQRTAALLTAIKEAPDD